MANEKKKYEVPTVTKVEFDFSDRIAASTCVTGHSVPEGELGLYTNPVWCVRG